MTNLTEGLILSNLIDLPEIKLNEKLTQATLPTESSIAWRDTFYRKDTTGIDGLVGQIKQSAVLSDGFDESSDTDITKFYYFNSMITSSNEFERELEASCKASGVAYGVEIAASASYLNKVKFSNHALSICVHIYKENLHPSF